MNFIRFLENKEDVKKKSIPHDFSSLNLSEKDFICDMYRGFESIDNSLSIFTYDDLDEKERIIVNYELTIMDCKNLSNGIRYLEFSDTDLQALGIKYDQTFIKKHYDGLAPQKHYDMKELTSKKIIDFILYFNNEKFVRKLSRKDLKQLINKSFNNNFINTNLIAPYLLLDYKDRLL